MYVFLFNLPPSSPLNTTRHASQRHPTLIVHQLHCKHIQQPAPNMQRKMHIVYRLYSAPKIVPHPCVRAWRSMRSYMSAPSSGLWRWGDLSRKPTLRWAPALWCAPRDVCDGRIRKPDAKVARSKSRCTHHTHTHITHGIIYDYAEFDAHTRCG